MQLPPVLSVVIASFLAITLIPELTAQRGGGGKGGGKGGGDPTALFRPVIISYPGSFGGGAHARYNPDPAWMSEILGSYDYYHPDQMETDGSPRALVRAVSILGDLTHGGGSRFVLDVREAADGSRALIATAETVGTGENPTWYYDGPGGADDGTDRVLLTSAAWTLRRARWSRDGSKVAFQATSLVTNAAGIWVADVVLDAGGVPGGLANIVLVAVDGELPAWGGNRHIVFLRGTGSDGFGSGPGNGFVVDVTVPTSPIEVPLGPVTSPPGLSSTGGLVVYSRDLGARWDLFVRDLGTNVETQITDAGRAPETQPGYPTWSPDDTMILFSVNDECSDRCRSLAILDVIGSGRRTTITKTFVVQDGKGRSARNVIVGAAGSAIWRD